jgi:hypothetical protein
MWRTNTLRVGLEMMGIYRGHTLINRRVDTHIKVDPTFIHKKQDMYSMLNMIPLFYLILFLSTSLH